MQRSGVRQAPYPVYPHQDEQMPLSAVPEPEAPRTQGRIVAVIALLVLMAVLGPMVYVLLNHSPHSNLSLTPTAPAATTTSAPTPSPTATPNETATAQAQAVTATAQAKNATATAIAGTTATAQAQASATAGVIQTATAGNVSYQDTLTNPNNQTTQAAQWDQNQHCVFQSDGYHVQATQGIVNGFSGCHEAATKYTNATYSVNLAINSGHSGGLFFDVTPDSLGAYSGYLFEIDTQGQYKISHSNNFNTGDGTVIMQNWTASSALKTGTGAKNKLQVIAQNGTLLFYINGVFVSQQQDTTFTSGYLGFLATTDQGNTNADVVYSMAAVYQQAQ